MLTFSAGPLCAADGIPTDLIWIGTGKTDLLLRVGRDKRVRQAYLGPKLVNTADWVHLKGGTEAYVTHGMEDYFEPAIRVLHADGNPSLLLTYKDYSQEENDSVQTTEVVLQDEKYPFEVRLFYKAYKRENVIKMWTEIEHGEKKPVTLYNYASSMLHFGRDSYWVTEFSGDWAHEVNMAEQKLTFGKKIVDTKLGSRANLHVSPFSCWDWMRPWRKRRAMRWSARWAGRGISVSRSRWTMRITCGLFRGSILRVPNTGCLRARCSALRSLFSLTVRKARVRQAAICMTGRGNTGSRTAWATG